MPAAATTCLSCTLGITSAVANAVNGATAADCSGAINSGSTVLAAIPCPVGELS